MLMRKRNDHCPLLTKYRVDVACSSEVCLPLLHWLVALGNMPGIPLAIEIQVSLQHQPDFCTGLLLRGTSASELQTEQQPTDQLLITMSITKPGSEQRYWLFHCDVLENSKRNGVAIV
ncbi:unnamed protein product [Dracunculus medinensis]|uniref:ZP domain-containing protein n=1 Tax=Dracunculus medinensis TaxID=318479 RepID=A0A0N4U2N9_DRAME|nr:unnamed protein product [Dracunculus medinensis]